MGRYSVAILVLVALLSPACGSDDGDGSTDRSGTVASGGSTGGNETVGGAGPTGGARTGGAPTGGTARGGGALATGGGGPVDVEALGRLACINWQANGFVLGCTAVSDSNYVSDCTAELVQAAESCNAEVISLLACGTLRTALDYACDDANDVTFAPGICETETTALEQCQS